MSALPGYALLAGTYDLRLVALSVVLAVLAAYTALVLAERVADARNRRLWALAGPVVLGSGVWAMHFTGMLALHMPVAVAYDAPLVLASLLVAIAAAGVALLVVSQRTVSVRLWLLGGASMGGGIAAMHYSGMAALRMAAETRYDGRLVALSLLIAVGAALAALGLAVRLRATTTPWPRRAAAALVMGAAIAGMHYTGMRAVGFRPIVTARAAAPLPGATGGDAAAVGLITLVVLGLALGAAHLDRCFGRQTRVLAASNARLHTVLSNAPLALTVLDRAGVYILSEGAALTALGRAPGSVVGRSIFDVYHADQELQDAARRALAGERFVTTQRWGATVFAVQWEPLRDADGAPDGVIAVSTDVSERVRIEEALRETAAGLAEAQQLAHLGNWEVDVQTGACRWSDELYRIYGFAPGAVPAGPETFLQVVHLDDRVAVAAEIQRQVQGEPVPGTCRIVRPDGTLRVIEHRPAVICDADGRPVRLLGIVQDVTARVQAEDAVRDSAARFRALWEHATDLVSILDADGVIRYASRSYERVLGYTAEQVTGQRAFTIIHPDDVPALRQAFERLVRDGEPATLECRMRARDGAWRSMETVAINRLADPSVRGIIATTRDITARKQAEEALRHQAEHDALTDLPNRTRLQHLLDRAVDNEDRLALLLLDLDHFKEVNDTVGHEQGDALLRAVAARLRATVRTGDTLARLGGDEFALLLPGADAAVSVGVGRDICAALEAPLQVGGHTLQIGTSVGIALAPQHGDDATTLLRRADVAMYVAKRTRLGVAVYNPAHDQHSAGRLALVGELRAAIDAGALALHYQPQVDLASGRVCGVEALVRWPHAQRGLIPPDQFIPLAEQMGLIAPLTAWVLETAIRACHRWQREGTLLTMSVNLSMGNLHDPALPDRIDALLRAHDLSPAWLRLELTETTLMADATRTLAVLTRLSALGVGLAVDDFGSGYSSLAYLKRLPVDELKIDKGFVREMARDRTDAEIVASTVRLGHALGLRVVAEGIEDRATWDLLTTMGCNTAQGYYLARPLPEDALACWLRDAPWARPGAATA